jgi:hypothetical protein
MKKLRAALRDKFGPRCYRINCRAEVEVYGPMPNTGIIGWYFYGYLEDMHHWFDLEA